MEGLTDQWSLTHCCSTKIKEDFYGTITRFVIPGRPQQLIGRGNNRDALFCAENDYQDISVIFHAYILMTNHPHLLITSRKRVALGKTLKVIGRYYVQYF